VLLTGNGRNFSENENEFLVVPYQNLEYRDQSTLFSLLSSPSSLKIEKKSDDDSNVDRKY
jgi:hypothetical protein